MSYCMHCGTAVAEGTGTCPSCGKPPGGATTPTAKRKMHPMVIVAIIVGALFGALMVLGIVAAIAIPNLLNAIDRGKQKRTMADLRSLGTAVEEYSVDHNVYPVAASIQELKNIIEPKYIQDTPTIDGWGNTFIVNSGATEYTLCSGGKDGGDCTLVGGGGGTNRFDDGIIFSNGQFVQWPQGMQR